MFGGGISRLLGSGSQSSILLWWPLLVSYQMLADRGAKLFRFLDAILCGKLSEGFAHLSNESCLNRRLISRKRLSSRTPHLGLPDDFLLLCHSGYHRRYSAPVNTLQIIILVVANTESNKIVRLIIFVLTTNTDKPKLSAQSFWWCVALSLSAKTNCPSSQTPGGNQ